MEGDHILLGTDEDETWNIEHCPRAFGRLGCHTNVVLLLCGTHKASYVIKYDIKGRDTTTGVQPHIDNEIQSPRETRAPSSSETAFRIHGHPLYQKWTRSHRITTLKAPPMEPTEEFCRQRNSAMTDKHDEDDPQNSSAEEDNENNRKRPAK